MAIVTLLAGLALASQAGAYSAEVAQAEAVQQPAVAEDGIEVRAVMDSNDPNRMINMAVNYARNGEIEKARTLFTAVVHNPVRYQLETAGGRWADSRNLAREGLAMIDRGDFGAARMAKAD